MTDPTTATVSRKKKPSLRATVVKVGATASGLTLLIFGGLWTQMAHGHDPVLSAKTTQPAEPQRIVVNRVVKRTVLIHKRKPKVQKTQATTTQNNSNAGSSQPYTGPQSSQAPAQAPSTPPAPTVTPTPAQAPTPAPVVTRNS